jgi:hypothetical protein
VSWEGRGRVVGGSWEGCAGYRLRRKSFEGLGYFGRLFDFGRVGGFLPGLAIEGLSPFLTYTPTHLYAAELRKILPPSQIASGFLVIPFRSIPWRRGPSAKTLPNPSHAPSHPHFSTAQRAVARLRGRAFTAPRGLSGEKMTVAPSSKANSWRNGIFWNPHEPAERSRPEDEQS